MSTQKRSTKSKFITEDLNDLLNESQFLNDSPNNKKQTKRQRSETVDKDITNMMAINANIPKKRKVSESAQVCGESRLKIINVMDSQFETRKQINENLLKSCLNIKTQMEADYNALKDNEQKLEHLTGSFLKCMQQATAAHKQKLEAFKDIHATFKKECDEVESFHKTEINKLGKDLENDMNKFKEKLISDTKHNSWEALRRSFIQAVQNDF